MKKHLVAAGIITAAGAAGLAGVAVVNATQYGNGRANDMASAIAKKFNLKEADVQSVFDEQRSLRMADRETYVKDKVAQLVKDGKLTQAQANKINAKRAELNKEREVDREAHKGLTAEQRKAKMEEHKTAIDNWLKDNNIDAQYRFLLGGGHARGGEGAAGHGFKRGNLN